MNVFIRTNFNSKIGLGHLIRTIRIAKIIEKKGHKCIFLIDNKKLLFNVDAIFTALPNGEAQKISKLLTKNNILFDLAADFRLTNSKDFQKWYKIKHKAKHLIKKSIYALPEIKKNLIKNYSIISCPGCYPTSILLPLIPLINNNLINNKNIIIDSKSGYSGAGRSINKKYVKNIKIKIFMSH